jgi:hypothetical protein
MKTATPHMRTVVRNATHSLIKKNILYYWFAIDYETIKPISKSKIINYLHKIF